MSLNFLEGKIESCILPSFHLVTHFWLFKSPIDPLTLHSCYDLCNYERWNLLIIKIMEEGVGMARENSDLSKQGRSNGVIIKLLSRNRVTIIIFYYQNNNTQMTQSRDPGCSIKQVQDKKQQLTSNKAYSVRKIFYQCLKKLDDWKHYDSSNLLATLLQQFDKVYLTISRQHSPFHHLNFLISTLRKDHEEALKVIEQLKSQSKKRVSKTVQDQKERQLEQVRTRLQCLSKQYEGKLKEQVKKRTLQIRQDYERKIAQINQRKNNQHNQEEQSNIFLGQLLHQELDYKQYVYQILNLVFKRKPIHSKLLYRMDPHNHTNIHQYIDNHPNILLVVKLKNEFMLAAFHEEPLFEKMVSNGQGIILSLTNRRCFMSKKRAVTYDSHHIIFGNSQIKIMGSRNMIFSNLGVNNGYYQNHQQNVNILFGEGKKREAQIDHYEILEVIFK